MRHIPDTERRARLARRHALAPAHRVEDPEAATRAMTVLHSTEPATVYLSVRARVDGVSVADVDRALYDERTLVKQLAMRRTLFVFPRDLLPAAWGSASARVAETERARMAKDVEKAGVAPDGQAWLDRSRELVLAELAGRPEGMTALEIRDTLPEVAVKFDVTAGSVWNHSRVLTHLGLTHDIVRGTNTQHWRLSRPRWTLMSAWLGDVPPPAEPDQGYAEIVARWLHSFGPGTEDDLAWWLGGTKGAVRAALAATEAVEVSLDGGTTGWVLPDDLDEVEAVGPWAALLPVLDPTVMGWKHRDFYLGPHAPQLFDRNGNAGTTAWWEGRVVGCWVQDEAGVVEVRLLERLPARATKALAAEAGRLTDWLDGARVGTVYPSSAMKAVDWVVRDEEQPKQAPPPVQRLRVRYAKRGRLRFTSHRDFSRAFERAVFRARLPMAYSSGFNPHPRISYAGAAPTGAASQAEYLELALAEAVDPAAVHAALDEALPDGLDVVEVVVSAGGGLAELMQASRWTIALPAPLPAATAAVTAFLTAAEVPVQRMTKKGLREFDSRAAVLALVAHPDTDASAEGSELDLMLRHLEPAVRPDDVLAGLASVGGLVVEGIPLVTREAQGPYDEATGELGDPLHP